jgi:hypothetical protein
MWGLGFQKVVFRWGYPHVFNPLLVSGGVRWCPVVSGGGGEALRGFVDKTEARLSPGSCTVQGKQLYILYK